MASLRIRAFPMNGERGGPLAPRLFHTGGKVAPCGPPSGWSWDHRREGVIYAQFLHRAQPHWEACYHVQQGKNMKPGGGVSMGGDSD